MTDTNDLKNSDIVITAKQAKAISAMLSERTTRAAAKKCGVNEKTLYQWLKEPTFQAALHDAEKDILDSVTRRLSAGQTLALDMLESLMQKARHESTRLRAAVAWLDLSLKYKDILDVEARLSALEQRANHESK